MTKPKIDLDAAIQAFLPQLPWLVEKVDELRAAGHLRRLTMAEDFIWPSSDDGGLDIMTAQVAVCPRRELGVIGINLTFEGGDPMAFVKAHHLEFVTLVSDVMKRKDWTTPDDSPAIRDENMITFQVIRQD